MSLQVWLNGELMPREAATVSTFDRSFLYGDGLFETVRAYAGVPFKLAEHLARLSASADALGIPLRNDLAGAVGELIRANDLADAYVRITVSRGTHTGALAPDEPLDPTALIEARPLRAMPAAMTSTVSTFMHDSANPLRSHKTTSYLLSILAKREAKERGVDEALLLDPTGHVAEGATSNVFCVQDGEVLTPPLDLHILPGVTRAVVIDLAREAGLIVREERLDLAALNSADEVFLTNSLIEVMPVRSLDGHAFTPLPGPVTQSLAAAYGTLRTAAVPLE